MVVYVKHIWEIKILMVAFHNTVLLFVSSSVYQNLAVNESWPPLGKSTFKKKNMSPAATEIGKYEEVPYYGTFYTYKYQYICCLLYTSRCV